VFLVPGQVLPAYGLMAMGLTIAISNPTARQGGIPAPCLTGALLKVELQAKLNIARWSLRGSKLAQSCPKTRVRSIKNGSVGQVQEFRPELEMLPFTDEEFLLKAEIEVGQTRTADGADAASSKCPGHRWSIGAGIKPLVAPTRKSTRPKTFAGAIQSARGPRELVPEASPAETVSGKPLCRETMLLTCQFPSAALIQRFEPSPNFLPRPKGNS
jgi:hypothetical protein